KPRPGVLDRCRARPARLRDDVDLRAGLPRQAPVRDPGPALWPGDGAVRDDPGAPGPVRLAALAGRARPEADRVRDDRHAAARAAGGLAAAAAQGACGTALTRRSARARIV